MHLKTPWREPIASGYSQPLPWTGQKPFSSWRSIVCRLIVLALILTPVANTLERLRLPPTVAAVVAVLLLALMLAGILSLVIPSIADWAAQAPYLTLTLQRRARSTTHRTSAYAR